MFTLNVHDLQQEVQCPITLIKKKINFFSHIYGNSVLQQNVASHIVDVT